MIGGWMEGPIDRWMNGWMDGWPERWRERGRRPAVIF